MRVAWDGFGVPSRMHRNFRGHKVFGKNAFKKVDLSLWNTLLIRIDCICLQTCKRSKWGNLRLRAQCDG